MSNTLNLGTDGNWAVKKDSLLGYNSENGNFKPLPFDFTRASSGTVVNKAGLIETVGTGKPRIDFKDNTKGSLLLEPQRSNLITYSESFESYWLKTNSLTSDNQIISPDGTQNACILTDNSTDGYHNINRIDISPTDSNNYTRSFYVKKGTARYVVISARQIPSSSSTSWIYDFDINSWTSIASSGISQLIEVLDNGWIRLSVTIVSSSNFNNDISIGISSGSSIADSSYIGIGDTLYLWGAQLEQGSYATSYIPTSGSAVTRVGDSTSQTVPDGVIGQTEGTVFVDVDFETLSGTNMFVSIRPDASNKIEIYRSDAIIYGEFASTNSFNFNKTNVTVGRYKIAVAYSSGSSAMYINGVLIGSNTTSFAFTSTLDDIFINSRGTSFIEQSNYNDIKLYNTRLTDQELIALTS